MKISVSKFWVLLRDSGLHAPTQVDSLRVKLEQADKAGSVRAITKQLIGNRLLTHYQARLLSQGRPVPRFGDYVVREPADQVVFRGWYVAEDAERRRVMLKPISPAVLDTDDDVVARASQFLGNVSIGTEEGRRFLLASDASAPMPPPAEPALPLISADADEALEKIVRSSSKLPLLWSLSGLAILAIAGFGAWRITKTSRQVAGTRAIVNKTTDKLPHPPSVGPSEALPYELTNSPEALWARPEFGNPIDLRLMPMGVQAIVRLRLAKLSSHSEGEKILRSLGPEVEESLNRWFQQLGVDRSSLETLTLGLLPQGTIWPKVVAVAVVAADFDMKAIRSFGEMSEQRVARQGERAFWFPHGQDRTFVFGPIDVIDDLRATSDSNRTQLRRELEQLRLMTHDTDQITILTNPNFLRDEAQGLFAGSRRPLLDGLYEFWSDHAQAVSLGIQLSDVAVGELRMIAREDWLPEQLAAHAKRRIESLPSRASDFLGRIQLDPYWQPLALRFPAMLQFATEQSRVAVEGRQVAVSTVLPAEALHNLLLATELTLASPLRGVPFGEQDRSEWRMEDLLAATMTVRIAQKSLEFALRDVARQVQDDISGLPFEFAIEIVGADLQLEGITRNQQIRDFHQVDRSVAEILTALVMKANPVQSLTKASDPDQELVWVVERGDSPRILITTRNAAANKNWQLPPNFLDR